MGKLKIFLDKSLGIQTGETTSVDFTMNVVDAIWGSTKLKT